MYRIKYLLIAAVLAMAFVVTAQNSHAEQKYWLDGNIVEAQDMAPGSAAINISALSTGLHWLTVSAQDEAGVWSTPLTKSFIVPYKGDDGKSIVEHQYWIDGNIEAMVTQGQQPSVINIETLSPGMHTLTVRVKDNTGAWSSQLGKNFIVPYAELGVADKSIVEHQYWIDGKIEAVVTQGQQPSIINIETLKPGMHTLTVRVKDNTGLWSSQLAKQFIVPYNEISAADKSIVMHQYWIDGKLEAVVSSESEFTQIPITTLKPGLHSLTVRVKDSAGLWSSHMTKYFTLKDDVMEETTISQYMYWFDDDVDNITTKPITSAEGAIDIDISDVEAGVHTIWWSCGTSNGIWADARSVTFESKSLYNYIVPESGVGTFSADVNLIVPDDLKAYFCTNIEEMGEALAVNVKEMDGQVIGSSIGVLLSGIPGETYQLRYTAEEGAEIESNTLVPVVQGSDIASEVGGYANFVMRDGQFVKVAGDNASVPDNSAYLHLPTVVVGEADVIVLNYELESGLNIIKKVDSESMLNGHIYNLNGQRLSVPRQGINIINGRKVIVR